MKKIFFILILAALGCNTETKYVVKPKLKHLAASDIYKKEKVYDVLFDYEEAQTDSLKTESRKLFLKGIESYKNKKNHLAEAIDYFKKSILIYPEAKTYYELANALIDYNQGKGTISQVDSAYAVAEHLGFQPKSILYFKMACVENLKEKEYKWAVIYKLRRAFEEGFTDTTRIYEDNKIKNIVNTNEFSIFMTELKAGKYKNNTNSLFSVFAKVFQPVSSFDIDLDNLELNDYKTSISYDFAVFIPEMQNTNFGRDVSHDYYYVAKVAETENYTALIYKSISFWGENMQPVITKISTYNKQGNLISSKIIAAQFSAEKVKKGKFENNTISIEDYKRIWKHPIDKVPFEENEVEKYELLAKAEYAIDDSGKIIEKNVPDNYNDSLMFAKK